MTATAEAGALVRRAAAELRAAGVASPRVDAELLLAHVLDREPTDLRRALLLGEEVGVAEQSAYGRLVEQRASRVPLQHLTGVAHFRALTLRVGPGVFVPRPETEVLVDLALADLPTAGQTPVVVDLCTGSGAIALSVATEIPHAIVHAVELDEQALGWAARNLDGSGVALHQADLAEALPELDGTVDVVVCNPPYIPLDAWESVAPEARNHDPHPALFSGHDGLDAMRVLERTAARLLKPGGVVGAEHADLQGESAPAVFSATGRWDRIRDHLDLADRPRYVTARLAP